MEFPGVRYGLLGWIAIGRKKMMTMAKAKVAAVIALGVLGIGIWASAAGSGTQPASRPVAAAGALPVTMPSAQSIVDAYGKSLASASRVVYMAELRAVDSFNGKRFSGQQYGLPEDEQGRVIWRYHCRRDGDRYDSLMFKANVPETQYGEQNRTRLIFAPPGEQNRTRLIFAPPTISLGPITAAIESRPLSIPQTSRRWRSRSGGLPSHA